ncbi:MAG: nitroreductase family protein [Methylotenera sp.]|nr:nitroreductase family protein [Methylotenera sp.]MDD4926062.1 nitroreductase family protein [Methylotenera sp.]
MMPLLKVEMNIFETILARRSIRHYKTQVVDQVTIHILLEAAVRAPTAMHQEPWAFVIIQDKALLKKLSNHAKPLFLAKVTTHQSTYENHGHLLEAFRSPDFNIFYNAGTLILICGKKTAHSFEADCWMAAENLMLAASAMGLGTCVIGSALPAVSDPEVKVSLGISNEFSVVVPIILGYPDEDFTPNLRKSPLIISSVIAT